MSEENLKTLQIGGLFHDIGKIGVPDNIIQKESRLTDDEYSEIKNHPSIGAHILSTATMQKFFRKSIDIIYRLGGDEFVIFLSDCNDVSAIERKIQSIIDSYYNI